MAGNPKVIKKLQGEIKDQQDKIDTLKKFIKDWGKLTGPMTPKDEQKLNGSQHGIHGKVSYEKAVTSLEERINIMKAKKTALEKDLAAEQKK